MILMDLMMSNCKQYVFHFNSNGEVTRIPRAKWNRILERTILTGWIYQIWGLTACLWLATIFIAMSSLISTGFPNRKQ